MTNSKDERRQSRRRRHLFEITQLALLLCSCPTLADSLDRPSGMPVPSEVIQEALTLKARHQYLATVQASIARERRHLVEGHSYEKDLLEKYLFKPHLIPVDNGQEKQESSGVVHRRLVSLEGSAEPLFFCGGPQKCTSNKSAMRQESSSISKCVQCKKEIISQQEAIQEEVMKRFPRAKIVATTQKLMNIVFVEMHIKPTDDLAFIDFTLSEIPGVQRVSQEEDSHLEDIDAVNYMGAGESLAQQFCGVGGQGVKIAVLDSGIDYTHERLGGPGTNAAYRLAYGTGPDSPENKQRNAELFPNGRIIEGYDFLGEDFTHTAASVPGDAVPDDNPIDALRHGTMVADAILSVAPQAQLLAYKVCTSNTGTCPSFAVLQALEAAVEAEADIVNLSLGGTYLSSYYDTRTKAMENVFGLGLLPVVAAGNEGFVPYIAGPGGTTPNAISVGSTGSPKGTSYNTMATYSSRGVGENNLLKPDITAPSGLSLAAVGTGNGMMTNVEGTSFSAPLIAGTAALVKERCPTCSPFALKAILMNNARRHVQYTTTSSQPWSSEQPTEVPLAANDTNSTNSSDMYVPLLKDDAPLSLAGAGGVQIDKALDSDIWAYSLNDLQPSLSFGLINAYQEIVLTKTIKVINISGRQQTLRLRSEVAYKALFEEGQENPLTISFSPQTALLPEGCNSEIIINATLTVNPYKAPPNHMTSSGAASKDPSLMDRNEFGGWIVIENVENGKDVSLPYMMILRQASHVTLENNVFQSLNGNTAEVNIGLVNDGVGVAQIDAFELLFTSEDDPEGEYGQENSPSDFRYVGYRVWKTENVTDCDYLLEFSFTTWEKQRRLNLEFFQVHLDIDMDGVIDYILFNTGVFTPYSDTLQCYVRNKSTDELKCTGFVPDHGTNTANSVLRVCSNDIGFETPPRRQEQINAYILTSTATYLGVSEVTDRAPEQFTTIEIPEAKLSAPPYDIYEGETLQTLQINRAESSSRAEPLGLMLITNSYRTPSSTGAATSNTETLLLLQGNVSLPVEITTDVLVFPVTQAFEGPQCLGWEDKDTCAASSTTKRGGNIFNNVRGGSKALAAKDRLKAGEGMDYLLAEGQSEQETAKRVNENSFGSFPISLRQSDQNSQCAEIDVPRLKALRVWQNSTALNETYASLNDFNETVEITFSPTADSTGNSSLQTSSSPSPALLPLETSTSQLGSRPGPLQSAVLMYDAQPANDNDQSDDGFGSVPKKSACMCRMHSSILGVLISGTLSALVLFTF